MPTIHQRHGQTDGQTDGQLAIAIPRYNIVHRAVKTDNDFRWFDISYAYNGRCERLSEYILDKKAVLSQGNRAMPQLFFSV